MNDLEKDIKRLIISSLNLEDISIDDINTDAPLFGEGLGLDSIDALELGMALQKQYNIKLKAQDESVKEYFQTVRSLAEMVSKNLQGNENE